MEKSLKSSDFLSCEPYNRNVSGSISWTKEERRKEGREVARKETNFNGETLGTEFWALFLGFGKYAHIIHSSTRLMYTVLFSQTHSCSNSITFRNPTLIFVIKRLHRHEYSLLYSYKIYYDLLPLAFLECIQFIPLMLTLIHVFILITMPWNILNISTAYGPQ